MTLVQDLIRRLEDVQGLLAIHGMSGDAIVEAIAALGRLEGERDEARDDARIWKNEADQRSETAVQFNLDRCALGIEVSQMTEERDALQARVGELEAGLRQARDLIDCIKQTSANVWWVDASDPETAVCDTYSALDTLLKGPNNVG